MGGRSIDVWNPELYGKFRAERTRPFIDLLALVEPGTKPSVLDLGCGSGELTRLAHERLSAKVTVGIDSSEAMLARAASHSTSGLSFQKGDLADPSTWGLPAAFDIILSNAAIHWAPDHPSILKRLASQLAPGGQLAIQVPANEHHPSHVVSRAVARLPEHARELSGFVWESSVLDPEVYASLLFRLGFLEQRVRVEIYVHVLPSPESVIDWVRGTLLTVYEKRLTPEAFERFLADYRKTLLGELPDERPYLFTYRRILLWGRLPPQTGVTRDSSP